MVDEIGVERDDTARLELIGLFLELYPDSYWRHVAHRYRLYSAWHGSDDDGLRAAAEAYLAEFPAHPESHGAVSRYYYEADIEPDAGLESAVRSVELYETILGTTGSLESLASLHSRTENLPTQLDYMPPNERVQYRDYLGSLYNLARYLVALDRAAYALKLLEPVLALEPFTVDEEATSAPFYLVAGDAHAELEDTRGGVPALPGRGCDRGQPQPLRAAGRAEAASAGGGAQRG